MLVFRTQEPAGKGGKGGQGGGCWENWTGTGTGRGDQGGVWEDWTYPRAEWKRSRGWEDWSSSGAAAEASWASWATPAAGASASSAAAASSAAPSAAAAPVPVPSEHSEPLLPIIHAQRIGQFSGLIFLCHFGLLSVSPVVLVLEFNSGFGKHAGPIMASHRISSVEKFVAKGLEQHIAHML